MGCIEHTQKGDKDGYAGTSRNGAYFKMHRAVYCEFNNVPYGDIHGEVVRHTCDNPRCINPEHLLLGTHQDNMADKVSRNRQAMGETNGNVTLTADQVRYIRDNFVPRSTEYGREAMSRMFGVSTSCISRVVNRHIWKHLE